MTDKIPTLNDLMKPIETGQLPEEMKGPVIDDGMYFALEDFRLRQLRELKPTVWNLETRATRTYSVGTDPKFAVVLAYAQATGITPQEILKRRKILERRVKDAGETWQLGEWRVFKNEAVRPGV